MLITKNWKSHIAYNKRNVNHDVKSKADSGARRFVIFMFEIIVVDTDPHLWDIYALEFAYVFGPLCMLVLRCSWKVHEYGLMGWPEFTSEEWLKQTSTPVTQELSSREFQKLTQETIWGCGIINACLGGNEVFKCKDCGLGADRNMHAERNILLRHLTWQKSLSWFRYPAWKEAAIRAKWLMTRLFVRFICFSINGMNKKFCFPR